jgi:hypothetical protein
MIPTWENQKTQEKTTLSTTNPTLTNLDANLGLCSESLVTNRLSHGMASAKVPLKFNVK